jgi:hypothetical protein
VGCAAQRPMNFYEVVRKVAKRNGCGVISIFFENAFVKRV